MKLYATIKNERGGKKSTGDDTRIQVELSYKNKTIGTLGLYSIRDKGDDLGYRVVWDSVDHPRDIDGRVIEEEERQKQKDECDHFIIKDDYGKEYCQECGKYNNLR